MTEITAIMIFTVAAGLSLLLAIFLALVQVSIKLTDLIHMVQIKEPPPQPTADYDEALRESPRPR